MPRTLTLLVALTAFGIVQPNFIRSAPLLPEVAPAIIPDPCMPPVPVVPPRRGPVVWDSPAPPEPTGAWWYGAMVPTVHQRVLYYPTWDTPCRVLHGKPPLGVPAEDIPQGAVPIYSKRVGQ